jgi:hypothetical protein
MSVSSINPYNLKTEGDHRYSSSLIQSTRPSLFSHARPSIDVVEVDNSKSKGRKFYEMRVRPVEKAFRDFKKRLNDTESEERKKLRRREPTFMSVHAKSLLNVPHNFNSARLSVPQLRIGSIIETNISDVLDSLNTNNQDSRYNLP